MIPYIQQTWDGMININSIKDYTSGLAWCQLIINYCKSYLIRKEMFIVRNIIYQSQWISFLMHEETQHIPAAHHLSCEVAELVASVSQYLIMKDNVIKAFRWIKKSLFTVINGIMNNICFKWKENGHYPVLAIENFKKIKNKIRLTKQSKKN